MWPLTRLVDRLVARCGERTLATVCLCLLAAVLVTLGAVGWYVGNLGFATGALAADGEERTVVLDAADYRTFARTYDDDREEGWCLYGSVNETDVSIDAVVPASGRKSADRIAFTCLPETAVQLAAGENAALVGAVHSHPDFDRSWPSKADAELFGRLTPVVSVMGVYTEPDGVAFFSERSVADPLPVQVHHATDDGSVPIPPVQVTNGSVGSDASRDR